jgi:hypothetical protein
MVLVTFAETKVTRVRADARIHVKTSHSDTKYVGTQRKVRCRGARAAFKIEEPGFMGVLSAKSSA